MGMQPIGVYNASRASGATLVIEETLMDMSRSTSDYRHRSRHNHTLDAIVDFRYLAPAKLARDEAHERMRAEAALRRLGDRIEPTARHPQLTDRVRQHLGDILILIGTRLQGVHGGATQVPAASDPGPATA